MVKKTPVQLDFAQKEKYLYCLHLIIKEKIELWQKQIISTYISVGFIPLVQSDKIQLHASVLMVLILQITILFFHFEHSTADKNYSSFCSLDVSFSTVNFTESSLFIPFYINRMIYQYR